MRAHFERRAADLADRAFLETDSSSGTTTLRLRPKNPNAVGVTLILYGDEEMGDVRLEDQASVPAEMWSRQESDLSDIDYFIDVAVEGRATAWHSKDGGCVEVREDGPSHRTSRTWVGVPVPWWRRRWTRIDYEPYT